MFNQKSEMIKKEKKVQSQWNVYLYMWLYDLFILSLWIDLIMWRWIEDRYTHHMEWKWKWIIFIGNCNHEDHRKGTHNTSLITCVSIDEFETLFRMDWLNFFTDMQCNVGQGELIIIQQITNVIENQLTTNIKWQWLKFVSQTRCCCYKCHHQTL